MDRPLPFKQRKKEGLLSPLCQVIDRLAVGPKGSRGPEPEVLAGLLKTYPHFTGEDPARVTTFFGGYFYKECTDEEAGIFREYGIDPAVFENAEAFIDFISDTYPDSGIGKDGIRGRLIQFLSEPVTSEESEVLARMLLEGKLSAPLAGVFLIAARLKLESDAEYDGMLKAISNYSRAADLTSTGKGTSLWLAEPFDGMLRGGSFGVLAAVLLSERYRIKGTPVQVYFTGSRAPVGPKYGLMLYETLQELGWMETPPPGFRFVAVEDYNPELAGLSGLREASIKRSFIATLEKMVPPPELAIDYIVSCAFHGPYTEKMLRLAVQQAGQGAMILRKGEEGSLNVRGHKPVELFSEIGGQRLYHYATPAGSGAYDWHTETSVKELPAAEKAVVDSPYKGKNIAMDAALNGALIRSAWKHIRESYEDSFNDPAVELKTVIGKLYQDKPADFTGFDWDTALATISVYDYMFNLATGGKIGSR